MDICIGELLKFMGAFVEYDNGTDESTLLILDIVVMLEDGSIANIEIQKIGYRFPGERSACYSSDLLLRQYKRVRGRQKSKFVYHQIYI